MNPLRASTSCIVTQASKVQTLENPSIFHALKMSPHGPAINPKPFYQAKPCLHQAGPGHAPGRKVQVTPGPSSVPKIPKPHAHMRTSNKNSTGCWLCLFEGDGPVHPKRNHCQLKFYPNVAHSTIVVCIFLSIIPIQPRYNSLYKHESVLACSVVEVRDVSGIL